MKTFFYKPLLSLFLMLVPVLAWADDDDEDDEPIQYPYAGCISLEAQLGISRNLKDYGKLPDKGTAIFTSGATNVMVGARMSLFPKKQYGGFFEAMFSQSSDDLNLNNKFSNEGYLDYDGDKSWKHCSNYDYDLFDDVYSVTLLLGPVYRYDISRWSFRPRFGLGWRILMDVENGVTIHQRNSPVLSTNYVHSFSLEDRHHTKSKTYHAFVYAPGAQICFTPHNRMYFTLDVSWMGTLSKIYQVNSTQIVTERETIDTTGRFYWTETYGPEESTRQRVSMGNYINLRFGVGWNIGK